MADFILVNNGTKKNLIQQVEKVLDQVSRKGPLG
jgi:dephospho-CoA kinase